jgi:subtilase family serine protease
LQEGVAVSAQDEALYDSYLTTPPGHQGVTFVASTGDSGSLSSEYPAFSPNVVAVGGTSLFLNANNSYGSETGWGGSGGGVSQFESEPGYQMGVQSSGFRSTPDVSFVADPNTGAWIVDSYNLPANNPYAIAGGTSLAAASWGGLFALVNQGRVVSGQPTLNSGRTTSTLDALYNLPPNDFNRITSVASGGLAASTRYSLISGLGSPVANLLIPDLVSYNLANVVGNPVQKLVIANVLPMSTSGASVKSGGVNNLTGFDGLMWPSEALDSLRRLLPLSSRSKEVTSLDDWDVAL